MKKFIITAIAMLSVFAANAQTQQTTTDNRQQETMTTEYKIISDEVVDGVRCVSAVPSGKVCSKQIDIKIKDGIIEEVKFTRGCPGNALGLGALIKGMSVGEAIKRLDGTPCGKRGTSCPDQLAQVLKTLR